VLFPSDFSNMVAEMFKKTEIRGELKVTVGDAKAGRRRLTPG